MGADQNIDWRMTAASALEWWRDAGVDALVDEDPRDWTAAPPPPQGYHRHSYVGALDVSRFQKGADASA
jgi:hypothetical protein